MYKYRGDGLGDCIICHYVRQIMSGWNWSMQGLCSQLPSVYIPDITWHHYIGWNLPDIVSSGKVSTLTGTLFFLYVWKFVGGAVKRGIWNKGILTLIDQKCFVTIADTVCVELTAKLPFIYRPVLACWQCRIHRLPYSPIMQHLLGVCVTWIQRMGPWVED